MLRPTQQNPSFFFLLFFLQHSPFCSGGCTFFSPGAEAFEQENMMEVYLLSVILATILVIPFTLKTFYPYVWMDILYFRDLLRILVRFVSRRRRRPLFFVLDRFLEQSAAHPDKLFIVFEHEAYSYSYTDKRSDKTANALQAQSGYQAGDTVALFMGNEPAFMFTWLALAKLGSPVALLNHNIRSKSLLHCFNCCKAKVLIAASGSCVMRTSTESWLRFLKEDISAVQGAADFSQTLRLDVGTAVKLCVAQAASRGSLSPKSHLITSLQINKQIQDLDGVV